MKNIPEPSNFIEEIIVDDIKKKGLKKIITRFPPEPNGFPHIGHVKSIWINFTTAQKFGGYTNLRMDDTNPAKESQEFVQSMVDGVSWLGFKPKHLYYASDYYGKLYNFALRMIKNGKAYVCDLTAEEVSKNRGTFTTPGVESPYRNRSVEENLRLFKEMKAGKYPDGAKTLRAKIDMASPNLNMRDPLMYKITRTEHFRQGNKWCIYPIYDFAHPLSDALEGITNSLCTLEFEDHRPLYDWFVKEAGIKENKRPRQTEFSKLYVEGSIMGKRHIKKMIDLGYIDGFDDPRLLTISGMKRRGYTAAGLLDFVSRVGVAKEQTVVEMQYLEHCIRNDLNKIATRVMAVIKPIKLVVTNYPEGKQELLEMDNNPNDKADTGKHTIKFERELFIEEDDFMEVAPPKYFRLTPGGMVRLKGAYIVKCTNVVKDKEGNIDHVECEYIPESKSGNDTSGLKVKGTTHWVNANDCVDITIHDFAPIVKEGMKFEGDVEAVFNTDSKSVIKGAKAEPFILDVPTGKQMQFLRNGYYVKDVNAPDKNIYINTVGLKDSYKPEA